MYVNAHRTLDAGIEGQNDKGDVHLDWILGFYV